MLIGIVLILMGALLALADWLSKGDKSIIDMTLGMAIGIGLAQSLASDSGRVALRDYHYDRVGLGA
jgi:undecaprenyl pyrophosphate phosphatase UppP